MNVRIDPDELVVPSLMKVYTDKKYPVREDVVTHCLDPAQPIKLEDQMESAVAQPAHEYIIALCRTSILHIVSAKESTQMIMSAGEYPMPELPPLPFSRVAIEAQEDLGWLVESQNLVDPDKPRVYIIWAVFISERTQGECWDVTLYWGLYEDEGYDDSQGIVPFISYTLKAEDGGIKIHSAYESEGVRLPPDAHTAKALWSIPIELAQIIGADSVPHEPVGFVSRQQRRQWQSKHPYVITTDKPRVYFVNLAHAGEAHEKGDGSRVYHCRWLVRGHWRHFKSGGRVAKRTTWVKAYVKGPVGAPWKGRPIYTDDSE